MIRDRYEYYTLATDDWDKGAYREDGAMRVTLNRLGQEGWELVEAFRAGPEDWVTFVFKRRVME